jgi:hypothetical protein
LLDAERNAFQAQLDEAAPPAISASRSHRLQGTGGGAPTRVRSPRINTEPRSIDMQSSSLSPLRRHKLAIALAAVLVGGTALTVASGPRRRRSRQPLRRPARRR